MSRQAPKAPGKRRGVIRSLLLAALALLVNGNAPAGGAGQRMPHCTLTPLGGNKPVDLQQLLGKVVYVDFWASWCGPCAQSFPFMNNLDRELRDRGLHVVGVNLDEDSADARDFLSKRPARFAVAADGDKSCAQSFGVKAMPSSYLIDRKGIIRHVHLGFRPGEAEQLRGAVERLLAENP